MKITFDENDRHNITARLEEACVSVSERCISRVLQNIEAAFQQQFDEEADYMINEFKAD